MTANDDVSLYEGLVTTRAIRRYRDDDIAVEDLNKMLFAATRGPSGHNTQPLRFLVLRRTPEAEAARKLLGRGFREAWAGSRHEPDDDDQRRPARMARTMNHFVDHIAEAPVIVLALFRNTRRPLRHRRRSIALPACQNLLLAARSMGYGGVITQWHFPVEHELADLLRLPRRGVDRGHHPAGQTGRLARAGAPASRCPDLVYEGRYGKSATWAEDPPGTRYTGG